MVSYGASATLFSGLIEGLIVFVYCNTRFAEIIGSSGVILTSAEKLSFQHLMQCLGCFKYESVLMNFFSFLIKSTSFEKRFVSEFTTGCKGNLSQNFYFLFA